MKELSGGGSMLEEAVIGQPRAHLLLRSSASRVGGETRQLTLAQPVKIGRSIARARPSPSNALFDCKVLSRNHALLWFDADKNKFFLQDTKSSNGTFVNSQRLSKGSEESLPREVCSGDVVQFGVDVVENSRQQVTHGCVIATLKLFLPNGQEVQQQSQLAVDDATQPRGSVAINGRIEVNVEELYQLHQCVQKALAREEILQSKLLSLKKNLAQTQMATSETWRSLIAEDLLLSRLETLERHLATYQQQGNDDKLKGEIKILMDERDNYQQRAKETLEKLTKDNLSERIKVKQLEQQLQLHKEETLHYKEMHNRDVERQEELTQMIEKLKQQSEEFNSRLKECQKPESNSSDQSSNFSASVNEPRVQRKPLNNTHGDSSNQEGKNKTDQVNGNASQHEEGDVSNYMRPSTETPPNEPLNSFHTHSESQSRKEQEVLSSFACEESISATMEVIEDSLVLSPTSSMSETYSEPHPLRSDELEPSSREMLSELTYQPVIDEQSEIAGDVSKGDHELALVDVVASLQARLHACEAERDDLREQLSSNSMMSGDILSESKLKRLVRVKERFHHLECLNTQLETSLSEMEEEIETMRSSTSRATAFAVVPILVILVAVVMMFLDLIEPLLGTTDL